MYKETRWSSSVGNEAGKVSELKVMPRNSRDVLGPAVFSGEWGMPS